MPFLAFLAVLLACAPCFAQIVMLSKPLPNWPQAPKGFNGLDFGMTKASLESKGAFKATYPDPVKGTEAHLIGMTVWDMDCQVRLVFLGDRLSVIDVMYPNGKFASVKQKMIQLYGPVHQDPYENPVEPNVQNDFFWYDANVFVHLTDVSTTHRFLLATYEYMKETQGGGNLMRPVVPTWKPVPADYWPQEPTGFNALKFDTSPDEAGKTTKLENCQTDSRFGNIQCAASLQVGGRAFTGNITFTVPHKDGKAAGKGSLTTIYSQLKSEDYAFVKAAFVKMYGPPHETQVLNNNFENLTWRGNKAEIRLNPAALVVEPNWLARGGTLHIFYSSMTMTADSPAKK